jgi:short-subunit dehydrogenase
VAYVPSHVVITGASGGLGGEIAKHYAARARKLTLLGRDPSRLQAVTSICEQRGAQVDVILCDVADASGMQSALLKADAWAPVDLIIANAAIGGKAALGGTWGEHGAVARHIMTTNALGVVNTVAPLIQPMVTRGRGCIVVIGSLAGWEGLPDAPAYSASKAAVTTYARGLRRQLYLSGVSVLLVSPGFIKTPMSASLPFSKPFSWTADRAAAHIVRRIARQQAEIVFPWPLQAFAVALRFLPMRLVDVILRTTVRGKIDI